MKRFNIYVFFALSLLCLIENSSAKRVIQSFYDQTCIIINYKCSHQSTGLLKLKVFSQDCLPTNDEIPSNCSATEIELVSYQDVDCKQDESMMKLVANESFHECKASHFEDHTSNSSLSMRNHSMHHNCTLITQREGLFVIELQLYGQPLTEDLGPGEFWEMSWRSMHGYIVPEVWPLLIFYQVSLSIYVFYSAIWLALCCYHRKDLLQLQYYIAFIIVLGVVEKSVFLIENEHFNRTGEGVAFSVIAFGEFMSALKRTAARILVIIVSVGFGIVKPRLGSTLYVLAASGCLYLMLSVSHGIVQQKDKAVQKRGLLAVLSIGLALLDTFFVYWIFMSLTKTMRNLAVRKNNTKLSVYKHFTRTLVFAVTISIIFTLWSLWTFQFGNCIKAWRDVWLDEAIWPFLFSLLLLAIMILWRPSANNQRYAYSPLADDEEDEESQETTLNESFDGIKLRSKPESNSASKVDEEDPLKWIEDNVPKSLEASSALLADDDVENTLFEISKLQ